MTGLILVAGAGGFIGGQLVRDLERQNFQVRAVDRKPVKDWYYRSSTAENIVLDLKELESCRISTRGSTQVYNLAADMGGMGFIEHNKALCMLSVLINTHLLMASREKRRSAVPFCFLGLRLSGLSAARCAYSRPQESRMPIPPCRGWIWLGEAFQRADVPTLPRRFRPRNARCALSQRLRPVWDLGRRPGEGARRD